MRKYQQLCLVIISILSITILLIYRSENSRLKYVLEVVNFFGRDSDLAINSNLPHDFTNPLPLWQRIGTDLHAYSSFWYQEPLTKGGLVITIVAGLKKSPVSFNCDAVLADERVIKGKFLFVRCEDEKAPPNTATEEKLNENFVVYQFVCKLPMERDVPKSIIFTDIISKSRHTVAVRDLNHKTRNPKNRLTECLDLLPSSFLTTPDRKYFMTDHNLLEYFFHHQVVGIDEFIIYDNGAVDGYLKETLLKHGIRAYVLPFNFPFEFSNDKKIKRILQMDCEFRAYSLSDYYILKKPNEYIYTNSYLKSNNSSLLLLDDSHTLAFEVFTNNVCLSNKPEEIISKNLNKIESYLNQQEDKTFPVLKKPKVISFGDSAELPKKPVTLFNERFFINRYISCDNKTKLHTSLWNENVNAQFLQYLNKVNTEVIKLKSKISIGRI